MPRTAVTARPGAHASTRRGRHARASSSRARTALTATAVLLTCGLVPASVAVAHALPSGGVAPAAALPAGAVEEVPSDVAARTASVHRNELLLAVARSDERTAAADRASRSRTVAPLVVLPVDGPVTSPFGRRWGRLHAGLDFGVPVGTPVRAVMDGVVEQVAYDRGGYGTHLQLRLADGTLVVYGHLSQVVVASGPVTAGQQIALTGDTGHSTGPHLHFELRAPDGPFDPRPWLAARGIVV